MSLLRLALLFSVLTLSTAAGLEAKLTVVKEDGEGTVISYPSGNRQRIEIPLSCATTCESCEPFGAQQFQHQQSYLLLGETCLGRFRYDIETGSLTTLHDLSLDCPDMMCSCRPLYLVPSTQPGVSVLCDTGQYWRVPFQEETREFSVDPLLEPVTDLMLRTGTIVAGANPRNGGLRDYSVIVTSNTLLLHSLGEPLKGLTLPENLCDGDLLAVYPRQPSGQNPRVLLDCINDGGCERYEITININDFRITSIGVPKIGTPLPDVIPGYVTFLENTTITIYRANYEDHGYYNFESHIRRVFTLPDSDTPRLVLNIVNKNWFLIDIPTFVSTGGTGGVWELPNSISSCSDSGACIPPAIVVPDSAKYYAIFTMEQSDFTAHVYSLTDPSELPLVIANINIRPSLAILHILETGDLSQTIIEPTRTPPAHSPQSTSLQPTSIAPTSPTTTTEWMSTAISSPDIDTPPEDGISPSSSSKGPNWTPIFAGVGGGILALAIVTISLMIFAYVHYRRKTKNKTITPIPVSPAENPRYPAQGEATPQTVEITLSDMHASPHVLPPQPPLSDPAPTSPVPDISVQVATPTTEGGQGLADESSSSLLHQYPSTPQPTRAPHLVPPRNARTPPPSSHFLTPQSYTPSDGSASSSLAPTPETSVSNLSDRLIPEGGESDSELPPSSAAHVQGSQNTPQITGLRRGQRALASQSRTDTVSGRIWPFSS